MMRGLDQYLSLNRQSLETLYDISPNPQVIWHPKMRFHDEAEEEIFEDVINIGNHLIGIVSGPAVQRSDKHRALNDKYTKQVEAKLSILQRALQLGILFRQHATLSRGPPAKSNGGPFKLSNHPKIAVYAVVDYCAPPAARTQSHSDVVVRWWRQSRSGSHSRAAHLVCRYEGDTLNRWPRLPPLIHAHCRTIARY
jgi:hypothetical protein